MSKRKLSVLLCLALLVAAALPVVCFAGPEEPLQFVVDSVAYLDNQTKLEVNGHYVNVSNKTVSDVSEIYLEIYAGGQLVAKGTYPKTTAGNYSISVGNVKKAQFIMGDPVQWLKLEQITSVSKPVFNLEPPQSLPTGKKVYYNGASIEYDVPPAVINGRLMVPARATFEKMRAVVMWNPEAKSITVTRGQQSVVLFVGKDVMTVDGTPVKLDAPPQIIDGRTLVPLRAISAALGDKVLYGAENEMAVIYSLQ